MPFNDTKSRELAADIQNEVNDQLLNEITSEAKDLERRHRAASNEVLAAIVWEAFYDAADAWGLPRNVIHDRFAKSFPTLNLFI